MAVPDGAAVDLEADVLDITGPLYLMNAFSAKKNKTYTVCAGPEMPDSVTLGLRQLGSGARFRKWNLTIVASHLASELGPTTTMSEYAGSPVASLNMVVLSYDRTHTSASKNCGD